MLWHAMICVHIPAGFLQAAELGSQGWYAAPSRHAGMQHLQVGGVGGSSWCRLKQLKPWSILSKTGGSYRGLCGPLCKES